MTFLHTNNYYFPALETGDSEPFSFRTWKAVHTGSAGGMGENVGPAVLDALPGLQKLRRLCALVEF